MSAHEAASWLREAVSKDGMAGIVKDAVKALKKVDFDTIAFRGMSGALIAPIVAHKMGKEIAMLRKPDAPTHSSYKYEGHLEVARYIILDDFVSSGTTVAKIISDMRLAVGRHVKFVGLYTYYSNNTESAGFYPSDVPSELYDRVKRQLSENERTILA